jgi:hypothetical protein
MKSLQVLFCLSFLLTAGCESEVTPILGCEAGDGMTPICGFQNPEDMARIGESDWILISQFGRMNGSIPGNIALFNKASETWQVVFPGGEESAREVSWGDPSCSRPGSEFAPHGLDLAPLGDERYRLLVVNHGGQDSVEMFEVINSATRPEIYWRGCVTGPEDAFFNDVVNLSDGGFLVSHMMPKSDESWATYTAMLGFDTGYVLHWSPDNGFVKAAGTDGPFPNGIELSEDESVIYLNIYMAGEVRKIDRVSGALLGVAKVANPDNITWGNDGLLVASHVDGVTELLACTDLNEGACGFAFEIVQLDPATMERTTLLAHRGPPMGAATVALQIGNRFYLGSFAGDRIVYVDLD